MNLPIVGFDWQMGTTAPVDRTERRRNDIADAGVHRRGQVRIMYRPGRRIPDLPVSVLTSSNSHLTRRRDGCSGRERIGSECHPWRWADWILARTGR